MKKTRENEHLFHDFDFLAGTWVEDEVCEKALAEFGRIEKGMWILPSLHRDI